MNIFWEMSNIYLYHLLKERYYYPPFINNLLTANEFYDFAHAYNAGHEL